MPNPPGLSYVKVVGTFKTFHEDSTDSDDLPDFLDFEGTGTITPNVVMAKNLNPGNTAIYLPEPFDVVVENGVLGDGQNPYVNVLAPSTGVTPSFFNYTVMLQLRPVGESDAPFVTFGPFAFDPIADATSGVVDLAVATPVDPSAGTPMLAGPPGEKGDKGDDGAPGVPGDQAYIQQVPRIATYLQREEKLSKFKTALASAGTTKVNIVDNGDSISEGTGASTLANRWQNALQRALRYRHGVPPGAEWPFIPTWPKTSAPNAPVVRAGTVTADTSRGLGWKAGIIADTGSVTFSFTGTSFKLLFFKGSTTGQMAVSIDGGADIVVDTNSITAPPAANVGVYTSAALTAGAHTVTVTKAAGSTNNIYLNGCLTFNGDETAGIRVLDGAYHGTNSTWFTSARLDQLVSNVNTIGNVGLVLLNIGTNDYGASTPLATYKANIELFISKLRAGGYNGSIALMNAYKGGGRDEATWAAYGDQLRQVAEADPDVAYFDWRLRMPDVANPSSGPTSLGLFADSLHPNDSGHSYISAFMADYLSLRA